MTIRRQWLTVLIVVAVLSVVVNAIVLSSLTDRSFQGYILTRYESNIEEMKLYLADVYTRDGTQISQINAELSAYLDDPITEILVYDEGGALVYATQSQSYWRGGMPGSGGMMGERRENQTQETDTFYVSVDGNEVFLVQVVCYSAVGDSVVANLLKSALLRNSLIAIAIVVTLAVMIGAWVSKRTSKALIETADYAQKVDLGEEVSIKFSDVREVGIIQHSLVNLKNRLKLKQKSRKTLIDELVHQTRTPLTILKSHLEGFQDGVIEMTPEEVSICEAQVENLTAIIANMSGLIDAGKEQDSLQIETFDLDSMMKKIARGLRSQMENKQIDFDVDITKNETLTSDPYKLSQSVYNLLTNACKYTPIGGSVALATSVEKGSIMIKVTDDGNGIPAETIGHIFDAYYRGDATETSAGDGLGLYIAKENITSIGGTITVRSEVGKGTVFTITVPKEIHQ